MAVNESRATLSDYPRFVQVEHIMSRNPPNWESIKVETDGVFTYLIARRNDVELKFAMVREDCLYLAELLLKPGKSA
jgi:hypothetical protein